MASKTLIGLFVLCVLASGLTAAKLRSTHKEGTKYDVSEQRQSNSTEDDWNESSDIARTSDTTQTVDVQKEPSFKAGANQQILEMIETEDPSDITETTQVRTTIVNGKIVNEKVTVRTNFTAKLKTYKIKTTWVSNTTITSVKTLVIGFMNQYAPEITQEELNYFNKVATVDGNKYDSNFNYVQVLKENLESVLRVSLAILKVKVSEEDIQLIKSQLIECEEGVVARLPATEALDVKLDNLWTIHAEFFIGACTKDAKGYQFFTYTSRKSGGWHPNWTEEDLDTKFEKIRNILRPWLFRWSGLLFTCEKEDVPVVKGAYGPDAPLTTSPGA